jgi:hypothetical protein
MIDNAKRENAAFRALSSALITDPKSVAREGYRACMSGEVIRVRGLVATGLIQAQRSITRTLTGCSGVALCTLASAYRLCTSRKGQALRVLVMLRIEREIV